MYKRQVYPNTLRLDFDNTLTRQTGTPELENRPALRAPFELFSEFYEKQNGQPMDADMQALVRTMLDEMGEGNA